MSAGFVFFICAVIFSLVRSSSIFTRNMIRMTNDSSLWKGLYTSQPEQANQLIEPEKFTASAENGVYQQIVLTNNQHSNGSDSESRLLGSHPVFLALQNETSPLYFKSPIDSSTVKLRYDDFNKSKDDQEIISTQMLSSTVRIPSLEHYTTLSTPNLSSEEVSKRYWGQYMNYDSSNFLQAQENYLADDKGFRDTNLWDVFNRLYDCPWSLEIINCIRKSFQDQVGIFSQYAQPQYPRFNVEENLINDELNIGNSDTEEGRRKLSKKLQMLLPLLIMLKMTMVPALAVMALVSGKAFLMSLLSLGVALFAASVHPAALSASKRHEVAPQAPQTHDHLSSNYYYVM